MGIKMGKSKENVRNSSLELLRIICMLLIIAHHYSVHGGYEELTSASLPGGGIFIQILSMYGKLSCTIFILISAYFLVDTPKIRYKKIIPLVAEMFFYSIAIMIIMYSLKLVPINMENTLASLLPIIFGNWFVVYYILLYLLLPYINPWLQSMDKQQYTRFLITLLIIWSVVPTFTRWEWGFSKLGFMVISYIIGGYIKLHIKDKVSYANKWNLLIGLLSAFLMIASVFCFDAAGYILKIDLLVRRADYFMEYNSILALSCAVFIFMYFSNIQLKNKWINVIAGSVLGIYLIHDNDLMRPYLWGTISPNKNYYDFPYLHAVLKIAAVFVVCLIIDLIREKTIGRLFQKWLEKV